MTEHFHAPATLRPLRDVVAEYEEKAAAIPDAISAWGDAQTALNTACCIGGTYGGNIFSDSASVYERTLRSTLLKSAWRHVYDGLSLDLIATAKDRKRIELAFEDPAPFTLDNIRATFGDYLKDPRSHILRGLAECFCDLDPAYKSHSKVKIGVEGLPKRVILSSVGSWGSWGYERLRDVINALNSYRGEPHITHAEMNDFLNAAKKEKAGHYKGIELRRFANGNGHVIFDKPTLREINLALAEYYGDVLPDTPDETAKRTGTAVSKDLQFYQTPANVVDELIERLNPRDGARILEPSCGDGAILEGLRRYADRKRISLRALGVEVDAGRAETARAKGFNVYNANFLDTEPTPDFDYVLMNPPFYGKHYQKHVEHARKFLKPGGVCLAILPITAVTDHGFVEPGRGWDRWKDLPVGSFSESGTNINTGIATFSPA